MTLKCTPQLALEVLHKAGPRGRTAAAETLGQLGDKSQAGTLAKTLVNDTGPRVRAACARALGALGEKSSHPALLGALSDSSSGVRESAQEALVQCGWKEDSDVLRCMDLLAREERIICYLE